METIFIYILIYIVPAFFLLGMAAFLVGRGLHNIESKLILLACASFFIAHIAEFVRHLIHIQYSPFLTMYVVVLLLFLGESFILHLCYVLLAKSLRIKFKHVGVFYLPFIGALLCGLVPLTRLTQTDFYWSSIWLYREPHMYTLVMYGLAFLTAAFICVLLFVGYMKSTNPMYKRQFAFHLNCGVSLTGCVLLLLIMFQSFDMPPIPTLTLSFLIVVVLTISIVRYNVSPSVAEHYKWMLTLTPTAVMILDGELNIIEANSRARSFFGNSKAMRLDELYVDKVNRAAVHQILSDLRRDKILSSAVYSFWMPNLIEEGLFEFDASIIDVDGETHYFIIWRNVTVEKQQEQKIRQLAFQDQLTGLHNRAYFVPTVEEKLAQLAEGETAVLILSDLNFFKQINDTFGHAIGDAVLQHTASLLRTLEMRSGIVARLGGDEFLLYVPIGEEEPDSIIDYLRQLFDAKPYWHEGVEIVVCPSFGMVKLPMEGTDYEKIYHLADQRMYMDKRWIKETVKYPFK